MPRALLLSLLACARLAAQAPAGVPDSTVLGTFEDDYGNRFAISPTAWRQLPRTVYRIIRWDAAGQYLIAQNGPENSADRGLWTRIDWMRLSGMPPYAWAFCLSAYKAASAAEAESTQVANRETPKTGCNGYPFSRMKPVPPAAIPLQLRPSADSAHRILPGDSLRVVLDPSKWTVVGGWRPGSDRVTFGVRHLAAEANRVQFSVLSDPLRFVIRR